MSYQAARSILNKGVSKPTLYSVRLGNRVSPKTNQHINFFCKEATVPSLRYNTLIAPGHERMGVTREVPSAAIFSKPLTLRIIENRDLDVYTDIRQWFDSICNNVNSPTNSHRMNYYDSYPTEIEIIKYESSYNIFPTLSAILDGDNAGLSEVARFTFFKAYPTLVGELGFKSDMVNQFLEFSVEFTYENYSVGSSGGSIIGEVFNTASTIRGLFN